jgi:hypothetical protein
MNFNIASHLRIGMIPLSIHQRTDVADLDCVIASQFLTNTFKDVSRYGHILGERKPVPHHRYFISPHEHDYCLRHLDKELIHAQPVKGDAEVPRIVIGG